MNDGYKRISTRTVTQVPVEGGEEGATTESVEISYNTGTSLGNDYKNRNRFPVEVGSNMMVDGVLAAGQIDAQTMRLASLEVGSANIDDAEKWLKVDNNGMRVKSPTAGNIKEKTDILATNDIINLRKGGKVVEGVNTIAGALEATNSMENIGAFVELSATGADDQSLGHVLMGGEDVNIIANNNIDMRTAGIRTRMQQNEFLIGAGDPIDANYTPEEAEEHNHRTVVEKGHVDVVGANLRVINDKGQNVLSVMGNTASESQDPVIFTNPHGDKLLQSDINTTAYNQTDETLDNDPIHLAMHGNVTFTSMMDKDTTNATGAHYLTVGNKIDEEAAVTIYGGEAVRSTDNNSNLLFIDMNEKSNKDVGWSGTSPYVRYMNAGVSTSAGYTLDPGTIYVRKGLLEIVPRPSDVPTPESGTSSNTANMGGGIIKASRLVANNVDNSGNEIKVPQLISDNDYKTFNGDNTSGRYDTFMVNPAYTSVMNDIKLVSRGGARLSDILPDFITKGLYLVKNDYDDDLGKSLMFTLNGSGSEINDAPAKSSEVWASPYSGVVPAPQCPPGYSRVISVTPTGFQMGQVGSPAIATWASGGHESLYVPEKTTNTERLPNLMANKENLADYTPEYQRPQLDISDEGAHTITLKGEADTDEVTYQVTGINNIDIDFPYTDSEGGTTKRMSNTLMAQSNEPLIPYTFQQNTFLKALQVQVSTSTTTYVGSTDPSYAQAWAILLGYIYPKDVYANFATHYGYEGSRNVSYGSANSYYWNIFPVLKTSIEAFASTYCYFDRMNEVEKTHSFTDERYNYIYQYTLDVESADYKLPVDYKKNNGSDQYWRHVNDPSMKYDEKW